MTSLAVYTDAIGLYFKHCHSSQGLLKEKFEGTVAHVTFS